MLNAVFLIIIVVLLVKLSKYLEKIEVIKKASQAYRKEDEKYRESLISQGSKIVPFLIKSLKNKDPFVRREARVILKHFKDERSIDPLIESMTDKYYFGDPSHNSAYHFAQRALREIKWSKVVDRLLVYLDTEDTVLKERIIETICFGPRDDLRVVPPLIQFLKDHENSIRKGAAKALSFYSKEQRNENAINALIELLGDEDPEVRSEAAMGLLGGIEQATDPLISVLSDENSDVQRAAIWGLGDIGSSKAVAPLIERLKDDNCCIRREAVYALKQIGDPCIYDVMIEKLQDEFYDVRSGAASTLGALGNAAALEHLIPLLECEDRSRNEDRVAEVVARVLGDFRDERSVEPLLRKLRANWGWGVGNIASNIVISLEKIGNPCCVPYLIENLFGWGVEEYAPTPADADVVESALKSFVDKTNLTDEIIEETGKVVRGFRDKYPYYRVDRLCEINTDVVSNILFLIANDRVDYFYKKEQYYNIDMKFDGVKKKILEELDRRGFSKYDPNVFLK